MITPTEVSSRARSNASDNSITVSGRKALRTSGRSIVIFAMPSATSYLMSVYSPAGCQSRAGSMRCSTATCCLSLCWSAPTINPLDDWLTHADGVALITSSGTVTYAELSARARRTARRLAGRGVGGGARGAGRAGCGGGRPRGHDATALHGVRRGTSRTAAARRLVRPAQHEAHGG